MSEHTPHAGAELHIASLVVHVAPQSLQPVELAVAAIEGMVVHGTHPSGKLVITLEGPSAASVLDRVAQIEQLEGVINVSLVYQHAEAWHSLNEEVEHDQHQA